MIISKIVNRIINKQYMSLIITIEQSWLFTINVNKNANKDVSKDISIKLNN